MSDTLTIAERQSSIEEVFDPSFIELLKLVPANPHVRALVLKFTGKMPPSELETFAQLKDWVELNCAKRIRKSSPCAVAGGIIVNVEFSEMEYGRADYSAERSGREEFRIEAGELVEMVRVAIADGEDLDGVVAAIANKIDGDAWNQCDPSLDNYGDYDYSEHDCTESDSGSIDYSREEIRNALRCFLQEQHPELAAEL